MATDLYAILESLLTCANTALAATPAGAPDSACVMTGQVAWDKCECGLLTVSLVRSYLSQQFPTPAATTDAILGSGKCGHPLKVHQIQVQILRCEPTGQGQEPPTCAQMSAAAQVKIDDAEAVLNGILCCLQQLQRPDSSGSRPVQYFSVGDQPQVGPQGGCGGSAFTVLLGFLNGCPCG